MSEPLKQDPQTYLAAERTFLSWIRTGLGLMGVGFGVARFGFFLHQVSAKTGDTPSSAKDYSVWAGVAIVGLGVVVLISAILEHFKLIRELREAKWQPGRPSMTAVLLAGLLAVVGLGMAIYLEKLR